MSKPRIFFNLADLESKLLSEKVLFLDKYQAAAYVINLLDKEGSCYGSGAITSLSQNYGSKFAISDTILWWVLNFLLDLKCVEVHYERTQSRGRPRTVYVLKPEYKADPSFQKISQYWDEFALKYQQAHLEKLL